jgi:glycosyltransferase involved in cell wall biosynthesis
MNNHGSRPEMEVDPTAPTAVDLTIVIPCKNEGRHIVATLNTIVAAMGEIEASCEILVMDDGSTDNTGDLVEQFQRENPAVPLRLHRNPKNLGLSTTYVDGAFIGRGKYYRFVSGDDAEPKEALVTIFRMIGKADMVIPYHEQLTGKSFSRLAVSRLYTSLVNLFSGYSIRYYNGSAIHLRYNVLRWHSYAYGFGFQADFITRLLDLGSSYVEVPVKARHTEKARGASPFHVRNIVSTGHTLMEILRRRINRWLFA